MASRNRFKFDLNRCDPRANLHFYEFTFGNQPEYSDEDHKSLTYHLCKTGKREMLKGTPLYGRSICMFARTEGNSNSYLGECLNTAISRGSRHFRVVTMKSMVYMGATIIKKYTGNKPITGAGFNDSSSLILDMYCYGNYSSTEGLKNLLQYKKVNLDNPFLISITIDHTNWELIYRDATNPSKSFIFTRLPPPKAKFNYLLAKSRKSKAKVQYNPPKDVSLGVLAYTWGKPIAIVEIEENDATQPISEKESRFWNAFIDEYPEDYDIKLFEYDWKKVFDRVHAKMNDVS